MSEVVWNQTQGSNRSGIRSVSIPTHVPVYLQYTVVIVLLAVFRMGWLTHQSLWFDEGYTLNLASATSFRQFLDIFGSYTTSEHLQPLYYFGMFVWSRFAGTSDLAMRLPSALCSIGSGVCLFALLRQSATRATQTYAFWATALFALSSFSVYYATEARPYALIQLCSFLVLLVWTLAYRQQADRSQKVSQTSILLAGACVLACLASVFCVLLIVSLVLADVWLSRKEVRAWWTRWRFALGAQALTLLGYTAFAILRFPTVVEKNFVVVKQPLWMNAAYTLFGTVFGTSIGPSVAELHAANKMALMLHALPILLPAGLIIAALCWSVPRFFVGPKSALPTHVRVIGLCAVLYAGFFFLGFGVVGKLNILPRHASALFALCVAAVIPCAMSQGGRVMQKARTVLVVALAGLAIMNAFSVARALYASTCRKDDYRAVAAYLADVKEPIYLVAGQASLLQHYGLTVHDAETIEPQQIASYLTASDVSREQITVVTNSFRNFRWDNAPSVAVMLAPAFSCTQQAEFAYFNVLSCVPRVALSETDPSFGMAHAR